MVKKPYLGPQHFFFEMFFKKVTIFFGEPPIQKIHQGAARKEMCPVLYGGFGGGGSPLITKKILDL
jgi:hypothetical protein